MGVYLYPRRTGDFIGLFGLYPTVQTKTERNERKA